MRVHRVVSAIDPGHVVNPLSIEMQTQGAIVYALTAALDGEITIKNGAAEQTNFDTYEILRLADAPVVETVIVPSGDFWAASASRRSGDHRELPWLLPRCSMVAQILLRRNISACQ